VGVDGDGVVGVWKPTGRAQPLVAQ